MYVFTVYFREESGRNEYANFANPEQRQESYHAIRIVYKCHYPNNKFHFPRQSHPIQPHPPQQRAAQSHPHQLHLAV